MGDLVAGDELYDESGSVCLVTVAHPIHESPESYRLRFDDGTSIDACADHLWLTFTAKELAQLTKRNDAWRARRRERRPSRVGGNRAPSQSVAIQERNRIHTTPVLPPPSGHIRTTAEIHETLTVRDGSRNNHAIPVCNALEAPKANLPIDPYLLGCWLGDGSSASGSITTADPEIIQAFEMSGYLVQRHKSPLGWGIHGLVSQLRKIGVYKNKHVPQEYLRSSREQRLQLLKGLMDTDGTVANGSGVEFCNTNRRLALNVLELARSLGWKPRIREARAKLYGKDCGPKWTVSFTPDKSVFMLDRKADNQTLSTRRTVKFRYVVGCERIPPKPMRCISVDSPSHLYLAGEGMIPTHNSDALLMAALQFVHVPKYAALILRKDYQRLSLSGGLIPRSHEWLHGKARWDGQHKRWHFPSGATLQFGYLDNPLDKHRYQSSEYQYLGFDELTDFREDDYRYMFSRLRKTVDLNVPLRVRSASNPGGPGHDWVLKRFFTQEILEALRAGSREIFYKDGAAIVPALIRDNPAINEEEYRQTLSHLDPLTRQRLMNGDWSVREDSLIDQSLIRRYTMRGQLIATSLGDTSQVIDERYCRRFATIDTAGTSKQKAAESKGKPPSWSVCMVWDYWGSMRHLYLRHVWRKRVGWNELREGITQTIRDWGVPLALIESAHHGQPLASEIGSVCATRLVSPMLAKHTGQEDAKLERAVAAGLFAALDEGSIFLPDKTVPGVAHWLTEFESEIFGWTGMPEQTADQIDGWSYAVHHVRKTRSDWGGVISA